MGLYDLEGPMVTGGGRYGDRGRRLWVSLRCSSTSRAPVKGPRP